MTETGAAAAPEWRKTGHLRLWARGPRTGHPERKETAGSRDPTGRARPDKGSRRLGPPDSAGRKGIDTADAWGARRLWQADFGR